MSETDASSSSNKNGESDEKTNETKRPTASYARLAVRAITSLGGKAKVDEIYKHILDNYPYYRNGAQYWKNCIRHNLSIKKFFQRSGAHWYYLPEFDEEARKRGTNGTGPSISSLSVAGGNGAVQGQNQMARMMQEKMLHEQNMIQQHIERLNASKVQMKPAIPQHLEPPGKIIHPSTAMHQQQTSSRGVTPLQMGQVAVSDTNTYSIPHGGMGSAQPAPVANRAIPVSARHAMRGMAVPTAHAMYSMPAMQYTQIPLQYQGDMMPGMVAPAAHMMAAPQQMVANHGLPGYVTGIPQNYTQVHANAAAMAPAMRAASSSVPGVEEDVTSVAAHRAQKVHHEESWKTLQKAAEILDHPESRKTYENWRQGRVLLSKQDVDHRNQNPPLYKYDPSLTVDGMPLVRHTAAKTVTYSPKSQLGNGKKSKGFVKNIKAGINKTDQKLKRFQTDGPSGACKIRRVDSDGGGILNGPANLLLSSKVDSGTGRSAPTDSGLTKVSRCTIRRATFGPAKPDIAFYATTSAINHFRLGGSF